MPEMTPNTGEETVRFTIDLPAESYEAIVRLQQLGGYDTPRDALVAALKLYGVIQKDGIMQIDPDHVPVNEFGIEEDPE